MRLSARLGWLVDGEFRFDQTDGPNRRAAAGMVEHLRSLGRIEPCDEALVMAVIMLAEACDSDATNGALWNQYRAALADIRGVGGGDQSPVDRLLAELMADDSTASVRDTAKRKSAKSQRADRSHRSDDGPATDAAPAAGRRSGKRTATGRDTSIS